MNNFDLTDKLVTGAGSTEKHTLAANSKAKMYGRVTYVAKDANGNVVDTQTTHNNIVLGIRKPIIALLGGYATPAADLPFVRQLALGSSDTAVTVNDTALGAEITGSRKLTATTPQTAEDGLSLTFSFLYDMVDESVDNQEIKEMALYTTDGTMIAHTLVGLWKKTTGLYFEVYWQIGYSAE